MAWTAPMTAVANSVFTAAQFNTHIRDNLLETAVAKATGANGFIVTTGANSLIQRTPQSAKVNIAHSTSSSSYVSLTGGPSVTLTTSTHALVTINARIRETDSSSTFNIASFEVTGATSFGAEDGWGIWQTSSAGSSTDYQRASSTTYIKTLTAGSNTFTMKYRSNSGTAEFHDREIIVIPL